MQSCLFNRWGNGDRQSPAIAGEGKGSESEPRAHFYEQVHYLESGTEIVLLSSEVITLLMGPWSH